MAKGGRRRQSGKVTWPGYSEILPRHIKQIGRNEPCPCGSEKKYKDCHAKDGSAYLEKLALEEDKVRLKAARIQMKKDGVPWYKRIFYRT